MLDLDTPPVDAPEPRPQFGLSALFGMVFALALYFAYLRQIDATAVLFGCVALAMGIYFCHLHGVTAENLFDVICAPLVGALIGVLIQILQWLEADRRLPRYTIASWLLCALMVGNWAVGLFLVRAR